jgi:hypothetical protein
MSDAHKPLTALDLADALSCFWNAAIGAAHERQEGFDTANIMVSGFSAVEQRLREIDSATPDTRDALIKELVGALGEIADIKERKKDLYPSDWREQIAACPECQRYKNHPIQQGICDTHRRPIYAQQDYDRHETEILGYRAKDIARAALISAKEAGYGAE